MCVCVCVCVELSASPVQCKTLQLQSKRDVLVDPCHCFKDREKIYLAQIFIKVS